MAKDLSYYLYNYDLQRVRDTCFTPSSIPVPKEVKPRWKHALLTNSEPIPRAVSRFAGANRGTEVKKQGHTDGLWKEQTVSREFSNNWSSNKVSTALLVTWRNLSFLFEKDSILMDFLASQLSSLHVQGATSHRRYVFHPAAGQSSTKTSSSYNVMRGNSVDLSSKHCVRLGPAALSLLDPPSTVNQPNDISCSGKW